ncbi:MAG: hypothetical protein AAB459_03980 [Patescibacteria group bacterium]
MTEKLDPSPEVHYLETGPLPENGSPDPVLQEIAAINTTLKNLADSPTDSNASDPTLIVDIQDTPESPIYKSRRRMDPIPIGRGDSIALAEAVRVSSSATLDTIDELPLTERVEFLSDLAYRLYQQGNIEEVALVVYDAINAIHELENNSLFSFVDIVKLQSKELNLLTVLAFTQHSQIIQSVKPTDQRNLEEKEVVDKSNKLLESRLKAISQSGTDLLDKMSEKFSVLEAISHPSEQELEQKKLLVGLIFENLYVNYLRLDSYEEDELVLGTTDFEDRSLGVNTQTQNNNYDVLVLRLNGRTKQMIQCKAGQNDTNYSHPIVKVRGETFIRFLNSYQNYLRDLKLITGNGVGVGGDGQMKLARRSLDELFNNYR